MKGVFEMLPFAKAHLHVFLHPGVNLITKVVYMMLLDFQGTNASAWPSVTTLAKRFGGCPRTVSRSLVELKALGWIIPIGKRTKGTIEWKVTPSDSLPGVEIPPEHLCHSVIPESSTYDKVSYPPMTRCHTTYDKESYNPTKEQTHTKQKSRDAIKGRVAKYISDF